MIRLPAATPRRNRQPVGRLDVEIVADVEDVRDQRAVDRVRLQAEVR
jgi:hypothetical protein